MAELVLGVGSSHSPMVSLSGEQWLEWGQRDLEHQGLYDLDGNHLSYADQLAAADGSMAALVTLDACLAGAQRVEAAVARLREAVSAAELDALIIVGDDQDEHLLAPNLPPFLVYWGDTITNAPLAPAGEIPDLFRSFLRSYREPETERHYPVATDLALHLIDRAFEAGFDVATSDSLPQPERGMGHAFGFPVRWLVTDEVPIVPVMVNTYNPPAQPRAGRCRAFGAMVREAVDSLPDDRRVGIIASGGLSHFVVHEALDRDVLAAFGQGDLDRVVDVGEAAYVSGTSEIKNWLTVASACEGMPFELIDYVPGYRTPAGTGTGLGFALWHRC